MPRLPLTTAAFVIALLSVTGNGAALAGFNCTSAVAATDAKKVVCADASLSLLNTREDTSFVTLRSRLSPPSQLTLVRDRVNFVRLRNYCGPDKRCLEMLYTSQLRYYDRLGACFVRRKEQSACVKITMDRRRQELHRPL